MSQQSTCVIDPDGNKFYRVDGYLHREDGPAIEYASGWKYYYLNGNKYYAESKDGRRKCWYLNGGLHREDGPAIEDYDTHDEWWFDGNQLNIEKAISDPSFITEHPKLVTAMLVYLVHES